VDNAPATAPTTTRATTSTTIPATKSTSTTASPSTTIDRFVEITAIFEDLERRRLQAIYDQNESAFRALYANTEYETQSLIAFEAAIVIDPTAFRTKDLVVLYSSDSCIAVEVIRDYSGALQGGGLTTKTQVIEQNAGGWGYSWIGEGWLCDGPHPLDS
jgi:hypothetical protein